MTNISVLLEIQHSSPSKFSEEGRQLKAALERVERYIQLAQTGAAGAVKALGETAVLIHLEKGLPYLGGLTTILFDERLDYRIAYLRDFAWTHHKAEEVAPLAFDLHVNKEKSST